MSETKRERAITFLVNRQLRDDDPEVVCFHLLDRSGKPSTYTLLMRREHIVGIRIDEADDEGLSNVKIAADGKVIVEVEADALEVATLQRWFATGKIGDKGRDLSELLS